MNIPRPKILVVDDTHANIVAMRRLLVDCGAELIEADSGNKALELCLDHQFALILLDVNMPEMDGFEVAALLSESEQLRDTPIIFVTAAYADDLNKLKGYRSGAVDYIAKPINDAILQSKVRVFLDLYSARRELELTLKELSERNQQLQVEIAERERIEKQVRHQATHDMLTGLPNRVLFYDRLHGAGQRAARHHQRFALLLLDIDGFKPVNDTYGHPVGDALLQAIAGRLLAYGRATDTVARLGGDEFALIMEDISELPPLLRRCQQICDELARPYPLSGREGEITVQVSVSIGIVLWRPESRSDEHLIQAANHALYQAKEAGRNRYALAARDEG